MDSKKVHIGLDLGIASVGWSIVDENQNIIAQGAHLFPQLTDPKTNTKYGEGTRGVKRRTRRSLARRRQRKLDFLNMIDQYNDNNQYKLLKTGKLSSLYNKEYQSLFGFTKENSSTSFLLNEINKYDVYKIWKDGFDRELNPKELFTFLYFKLSMRGSFHINDKTIESSSYETSLLKNHFENKILANIGKYRSEKNSDEPFSIYNNWNDIECILRNCKYINEQFINDYKNIFMRHREFSKGPGSYKLGKHQSPWGIQASDKDNPTKPEFENLWDSKIGYCNISLYNCAGNYEKTEKKLNNFFFIGSLSNLISQLVYLKIDEKDNKYYLDKIIEMVNYYILRHENITKNRIKNYFKENGINNIDNIKGFPTTKDKTDSNFESLEKITQYFDKEKPIIRKKDFNIKLDWQKLCELEEIRFVIASKFFEKATEKDNIQNKDLQVSKHELARIIKEKNKQDIFDYFDIEIDEFLNFNKIKETDFNGTYNYGKTAYYDYVDNFFRNPSETNGFGTHYKNEISKSKKYIYKFSKNNSNYLPEKLFDKMDFISPNVKNTLLESIRVLNRILRQYIYKLNLKVESIMLESTSDNDKNTFSLYSKQKKEDIVKEQNWYEKRRKDAELFCKENSIPLEGKNWKKVALWKEQGEYDLYTGKKIPRSEIIECQIDHIIPESKSFNTKLENLVLTKDNNWKSNKVPMEFATTEIIELWDKLYKIDEKSNKKDFETKYKELKINNLKTTREDLNKINFINRNLSETTYAISKFIEALRFYKEQYLLNDRIDDIKNENNKITLLKDMQIRSINGYYSQKLRKLFGLDKKDREISNHHAHDASLIAIFSSIEKINKFYNFQLSKTAKHYVIENRQKDKEKENTDFQFSPYHYLKSHKHDLKLENIAETIDKTKCIFSFKKVTILPKRKKWDSMDINEQFKYLESIKPKQLFNEEQLTSYIVDNHGNCRQKSYYSLITGDESKIWDLFIFIKKQLVEKFNNDESKIKDIDFNEFDSDKFFYNFISSREIIYRLYSLIKSEIRDDISELSEEELKDIKKRNIFSNYLNNIFINNQLDGVFDPRLNRILNKEFDKIYIDKFCKEYIPIIQNNRLQLISKIRIVTKSFDPDWKLSNKKLSRNNIFMKNDEIKTTNNPERFLRNTTYVGANHKAYILLKYKNNNDKEIMNYFVIDQFNKIIDEPKNSEKVLLIDKNKWYKINNDIYKISYLHPYNHNFTIKCISDKNKKSITKTLSGFIKSEDLLDKNIYKIICKQNKEI